MTHCVCGLQGETLSYAELDKRVNQLARQLIAMGVGPEVPVGVLMERSLDLIVSLLAVLKAGGAYVPMDPSYPPERLAMMMEDTEVPRASDASDRQLSSTSEAMVHINDFILRRRLCC